VDGTAGQTLTTNGAGTLSFATVTSYTNSDVDAHLNTGTAASGEVLSWTGTDYDWVAVSGGANSLGELSDASTTAGQSLSLLSVYNEYQSTFIGSGTGGSGQTESVAVGYNAGLFGFGDNNVAVGNNAGRRVAGQFNIFLGSDCVGFSPVDRTGSGNIFLAPSDFGATQPLTTGLENVSLGFSSSSAITTGSYNVHIGSQAANASTTGSNQIVIGRNAAASSATVSDEITLGNSSITTLRCQVTTITSLSDARDKTNIQPLNAGLEFVEALNPVSFTWNMRDGGKVGEVDTGFIAQDLQAAQADTGVTIPGLVFDANPEKLEAGYGKLIPVLVQAIKDLSAKVNELETRLENK
jgi:hypothetical protein